MQACGGRRSLQHTAMTVCPVRLSIILRLPSCQVCGRWGHPLSAQPPQSPRIAATVNKPLRNTGTWPPHATNRVVRVPAADGPSQNRGATASAPLRAAAAAAATACEPTAAPENHIAREPAAGAVTGRLGRTRRPSSWAGHATAGGHLARVRPRRFEPLPPSRCRAKELPWPACLA
jgi:hypothetical protein